MLRERERLREPAERDRHVHEWSLADGRGVEAARRDADDRQRLAVDDERAADHAGIGAEGRLPVRVAQHDGARLADDAIVVGIEQTTRGGLNAEQREVLPGHEQRTAGGRLALEGEARVGVAVCGDSFERPIDALEIAEHGVAEDFLARAAVVARRVALLEPRRAQVHEPVRLRNGQLAQQDLVVHREDRRVDADPERQRRHDDQGQQRLPHEAAQAEPDVVQQISHGSPSLILQ